MPTFRLLTSHGTELCTAPALPAFHSQPAAAHGPLLLDVEPGGRDGVVNAGIGVLIRGPIEPKRVRSIRIEPVGTGEVSLRDTETGYYLCAAPPSQGWGDLALCAPTVGEWERFRLEDAGIDPLQGAFATNTARVGTPLPASAGPSCVPSGLDAIGLAAQPWSIERAANLLLMRSIRPTRRAAVVASFRNEGACILEWLAHARAVGFAHAFIYTNGNTDGSDGLLEALHHAGSLTLLRNEVSASVSPQVKAYEHSIHLLPALRDFEWVAYLDADELLVPDARHDHSVVALIDAVDAQWTAERPAAICVNWHWYGSGGQVFRSDGLLQERFIHARPHSYVKSIVRLRDISTMAGIHIPDPGAVLCVSSGGERLPINQADAGRVDFRGAKLNHYYHRSFEEFVVKHERGRGGSAGGGEGKEYRTFFEWDVPCLPAREAPTPPALLRRVKQELALLRQAPGVADAEEATLACHRHLARHPRHQEMWRALERYAEPAGSERTRLMLAAD